MQVFEQMKNVVVDVFTVKSRDMESWWLGNRCCALAYRHTWVPLANLEVLSTLLNRMIFVTSVNMWIVRWSGRNRICIRRRLVDIGEELKHLQRPRSGILQTRSHNPLSMVFASALCFARYRFFQQRALASVELWERAVPKNSPVQPPEPILDVSENHPVQNTNWRY